MEIARRGEVPLIDPDLFKSVIFRLGITAQGLQQIALGGSMTAVLVGVSVAPGRRRVAATTARRTGLTH